ncbi:MAG: glycosyltransferase family 4 protein [Armatimonadota bacterium]
MPRRRLAVVMPQASVRGGAELCLLEVLRSPAGRSVDWHVLFLRDGPLVEQVRETGATVACFPIRRTRDAIRTLEVATAIARHAKAHHCDALVGWLSAGQVLAGLASLLGGPPNVWHQMGNPRKENALDRAAGWLPTRGIVVCSQGLADEQRVLSPKAPMSVCHLGAQLDRFDPDQLPAPGVVRARLGLRTEGPWIGIVGRLQPWKGMHVLLDAAPAVRERHPNARFLIVGGPHDGDTSYPDALTEQARRLGIADHVTFAGPQDNIPEWMQAMDVVVHASDNEPFGIVVVEAMALGKPLVAADSGGPREMLVAGEEGLLTPFGDAPRLADAIVRLLDDPEHAAAMGAAARRRSRQFSMTAYGARFLDQIATFLGWAPIGANPG